MPTLGWMIMPVIRGELGGWWNPWGRNLYKSGVRFTGGLAPPGGARGTLRRLLRGSSGALECRSIARFTMFFFEDVKDGNLGRLHQVYMPI